MRYNMATEIDYHVRWSFLGADSTVIQPDDPADDDPADLEFSPEQMRAMGEATLSRVIDHIATLDRQPACGDVQAHELCRAMREPAPESGTALESLLEPLFRDWIPRSFNAAGPGYLAYIPGGGLFPAALADLIADGTNRYTGVWQAAPALVQLEANVLDWFRDWMSFPTTTRGLLTTGGSMAGFNALLCARERLAGIEPPRGRSLHFDPGTCLGCQIGQAGGDPGRPGAADPGR